MFEGGLVEVDGNLYGVKPPAILESVITSD